MHSPRDGTNIFYTPPLALQLADVSTTFVQNVTYDPICSILL